MRIHTHASKVLAGALALVCIGQAALAGLDYTPGKGIKINYAEDKAFTAAIDVRVRLSHWDRDVLWPEGTTAGGAAAPRGPAVEYMRVRTRLKLGLDLWDDAKLTARFVNRSHNVSSSFSNPNDNGAGNWTYPDETVLDHLALTLNDLGMEGLTLVLGRQDLILGNGMVFLEGTPYDQGRTIYFDGASLRYKNECDSLILFAFYNEAEDEFVVMGDEDRQLRRGDIFTAGIDWTHKVNKSFNSELYYIYANVDDNDKTAAAREFESDSNAELHTVGARLFGDLTDNMGYSVEVARMFGEYDENPTLDSGSSGPADAEGWMVDARLMFKNSGWNMDPTLMLEYTYFSGDDPDTDDYEGWDGLFAEYPIFTEELIPIMINSSWTNLHQMRAELKMKLCENITFTGSYAHLLADEDDLARSGIGGGNGGHFGDIFGLFLDYKINDYVTVSLQGAFFESGDYWDTNADSEWLRIQTVFSF